MTKFKVGDRVRCVRVSKYDKQELLNEVGTIKVIDEDGTSIGVAFDADVDGHSLAGMCKNNHGWWVTSNQLEKYKDTSKVIIYVQGRTVTAKLLCDKECMAQAIAKCSPDDAFDVLVGAQIALQRLAAQQDAKIVVNTKAFGKDIELI